MNMIHQKSFFDYIHCRQTSALIFIIFLVIITYNGFSYINWDVTYGGRIINVVSIFFLFFLFAIKKNRKKYNFYNLILALTFLPFLSSINSNLIYGQPFFDSITVNLPCLLWCLYFVLHYYKVRESTILKALLYISIIIVSLQVIQQFTYPVAMFGVSKEANYMLDDSIYEVAEKRNGLWRFRMHHNGYYTAPLLFLTWLWIRKKIDLRVLLIFLLFLISIYLTLTRQVLFATILTLFLSIQSGKRKNLRLTLFSVILIGILYMNYDVLFSSLAEQTQSDMTEDNVRLRAGLYFLHDSLRTPFTFLLGHGVAKSGVFLMEVHRLQQIRGYHFVDVGFIGMIWQYGFIYVCICYYLLYIIFFKQKKNIPLYIRLFVLFTTVMSVMIFPMSAKSCYIIWSLILYICDLHLNDSYLANEYK